MMAVATVFLIASLDELRQAFSPGRTGVFSDVLLDSFGALFFVVITAIIVRLLKNKERSVPKAVLPCFGTFRLSLIKKQVTHFKIK